MKGKLMLLDCFYWCCLLFFNVGNSCVCWALIWS